MTNEENKTQKVGRPAGFRDFYPEEFAKINFVLGTMRQVSQEFGYVEYETPAVEYRKLYELKSGEGLISETFQVESRSGQKLVLIPELTPSLTRLLAERQQFYTKPLRWFSIPKCYRDETLQRGRVKEFWQYNADILGVADIYADAEIIAVLTSVIQRVGLSKKQFVVLINDRQFMQKFMEELGIKDFVTVIQAFDKKAKVLQEKIQNDLKKKLPEEEARNVALIIRQAKKFDESIYKKIPKIKEVTDIIDNFDDYRKKAMIDSLQKLGLSKEQITILYDLSEIKAQPKKFLQQAKKLYPGDNPDEILANLIELAELLEGYGITDYVLFDGSLARGLDYYTGIIFEVWSREGLIPRAIAGGGRYSDLVATMGGNPLTGTGFGFGETVLMELMKDFKIPYPEQDVCDVYIAPLKLDDISEIIDISSQLRKNGLRVVLNSFNWKIKRHFENAEKQNITWMIIVGNKDLAQNAVTLRNIVTGEQEIVPIKKIVSVLKKRIK
ncbi:MAG: histidine--tRNA ligase [Candidatus Heimdallarchaeota archaeon]